MRELTNEEKQTRDRRRAGFEQFRHERMPVLADFASRLGLQNPPMIVAEPDRYLPSIDQFMRDQTIDPEDRTWILTRLGYLIGEILVTRHGGVWMLNEIPESRTFLRYVVGQFAPPIKPNAMVDPFAVADAFLAQPTPRSLAALVADVDAELRNT